MQLNSKSKNNLKELETLVATPDNQSIILAICEDRNLRLEIFNSLNDILLKHHITIYKIDIGKDYKSDTVNLIKEINRIIRTKDFRQIYKMHKNVLIFVEGTENLGEKIEASFIQNLDLMRDDLVKVKYPVIIWFNSKLVGDVAQYAPGFWSLGEAVYEFDEAAETKRIDEFNAIPEKKSIKMVRAQNLEDAYNSLTNLSPLSCNFKDFHILRLDDSLFNRLKFKIKDTSHPVKILFTGPVGSGLSTELWKLSNDLVDSHITVMVSVKNWIGVPSLDSNVLLILMLYSVYNEVSKRDIKLSETIFAMLNKIIDSIEHTADPNIKKSKTSQGVTPYTTTFRTIVFSFLNSFRSSEAETSKSLYYLENTLPLILETINLLTAEIEKSASKSILLIVDDLDKISYDTAIKIFCEHNTVLTRPYCRIIYSCPPGLFYDPSNLNTIKHTFDDLYFINYIRTSYITGATFNEGLSFLEDVIFKRVEKNIIDGQALATVIKMSGGNISELLRIIADSALSATADNKTQITLKEIEETTRNIKTQYSRIITKEDYELLYFINRNKSFIEEKNRLQFLRLLSYSYIIEYRDNDSIWYEVNPIIKLLLTPDNAI